MPITPWKNSFPPPEAEDAPPSYTAIPVRRRRIHVVITLAQEAKNRFSLTERSEAMRLTVRKFIFDRMTEHGMRPSHIRESLDLAVELAFTPDKYDIEATQFSMLSEVAEQRRLITSNHISPRGWRDWFVPHVGPPPGFQRG